MKITITSSVENGKLVRNRTLLSETIQRFNGKEITITIEQKRKKRSNQQNRYLHALFTIFKNELNELGNKFTVLEVKDLCKYKFSMVDVINEESGEVIGQRIKGTSEMTPTELNTFFEEIIQWAAEAFHIELPLPNENLQINF